MSLLCSRPNSRCCVTGTQSEQLFFERENALFRGELENADHWNARQKERAKKTLIR